VLVAGVHSDAEIIKNKGPPLMNEEERYEAIRACKWVDEVVEDAPYQTQIETLDEYNIDYCAHGDDITTMADGTDCYALVKEAGRYKEFKRTQGVSTTDLIDRMLVCIDAMEAHAEGVPTALASSSEERVKSALTKGSDFIATSAKIAQFSNNATPQEGDTIVYVDGAWDVLHAGHISILKQAKEMGDFLYVGVYDDALVNSYKGYNLPLATLQERVLSLLSCRYVDDVVIGSPLFLSEEYLNALGVNIVVHGSVIDQPSKLQEGDPYAAPKTMGIYQTIQSEFDLTTTKLLERVAASRHIYEERNRKKQEKEIARLAAEAQ